MKPQFTYKGHGYTYQDDEEEDNVKRWHTCIMPDGTQRSIDFSPYFTVREEDFKLWIDLGMPRRFDPELGHNGNIFREDLYRMRDQRAKKG